MRGHWYETAGSTLVAAALIAWLTRKAIATYFFAEAFVYLGAYEAAGHEFWGAVFGPHTSFFRPSLWAVNLAWNLIAPPDALLYHLRNCAFVVANALLLHRLLLRLVPNVWGRAAAIAFYAISKVHLTTIGYVATFSTILVLFATLSMLVAFCRWNEERRWLDYAAVVFFATFLVFSKDYGMVALLLLPLLNVGRASARPFLAPFAILIVLYAILRLTLAPPIPTAGAYAPRLETRTTVSKVAQAAGTLTNLPVGGTEDIVGVRIPGTRVLFIAIAAFFALLWWRTKPSVTLFTLAWGALFFAPTLLTRNQQLYYHNDLVAAFAVLLGAMTANATRAWRIAVAAVLLVMAVQAELGQRTMRYTWYRYAERARKLVDVAKQHPEAKRIAFVTPSPEEWEWVLGDPFVPTVLGRDVDVQVTRTPVPDALVIPID